MQKSDMESYDMGWNKEIGHWTSKWGMGVLGHGGMKLDKDIGHGWSCDTEDGHWTRKWTSDRK